MAKRQAGSQKTKQASNGENGGIVSLTKELFQAAITLRGSVEPADYKRYVLPIIFQRFLSLRYDRRRAELEALIADKKSDYFDDKKAIHDPDEYRRVGAFVIPEAARWENLRNTLALGPEVWSLVEMLRHAESDRVRRGARCGRQAGLGSDQGLSQSRETIRRLSAKP